jgi:hypothetical protein
VSEGVELATVDYKQASFLSIKFKRLVKAHPDETRTFFERRTKEKGGSEEPPISN